jgi:hypothetical protein
MAGNDKPVSDDESKPQEPGMPNMRGQGRKKTVKRSPAKSPAKKSPAKSPAKKSPAKSPAKKSPAKKVSKK